MSFKAICFDLDGTLLDTLDDLADSMNRALAAHDLPTHPVEAYKTFVGNGLKVLVQRAAPTVDDPELSQALIDGMRAEYGKRWAEKTRPYEGVAEMLTAIQQQGIPMAVLSNKPHEFTELCVAELLPHWKFQRVYGVQEEVPPKPDPTGAKRVAQELGVAASEVLYVGDTNTDMETGSAAGMYAVGVTWGFRDADELTAAGAKQLINHPSELLTLI
jgi:phosphoglycolate phosphatase